MKAVTVFCGSAKGTDPLYEEATKVIAHEIVKKNLKVVYGGAHVGLMGVLADTALKAGGEVIGVIPKQLVEQEVAHTNLTKLHIVDTMHERKELMASLSQFIEIC